MRAPYSTFLLWILPCVILLCLVICENFILEVSRSDLGSDLIRTRSRLSLDDVNDVYIKNRFPKKRNKVEPLTTQSATALVDLSEIYPAARVFVEGDGAASSVKKEFETLVRNETGHVVSVATPADMQVYLAQQLEMDYRTSTTTFILGASFHNTR